jgi:amidase
MTAAIHSPRPKLQAKPDWRDVAKRVKARIDDAIPASYRIDPGLIPTDLSQSVLHLPAISRVLSSRELEITESHAYEILPKLVEKTYTSVEVTQAFCKRATIAHQAVCSSKEIFKHSLFELQIYRN